MTYEHYIYYLLTYPIKMYEHLQIMYCLKFNEIKLSSHHFLSQDQAFQNI